MKFKNYLLFEDDRNTRGTPVFRRLLARALKSENGEVPPHMVMIAHHIVYEVEGDQPIEIPSADTLIFDPDIMGAVFGPEKAGFIMRTLVMRRPELRDVVLADFLDALDREEKMDTQLKAAGGPY